MTFKCNTGIDGEKRVYLFRGSEKIFEVLSMSEPVVFFTLANLTWKSGGMYRCMSEISQPKRKKSQPSDALRLTMLGIQAPLSILRPPAAEVSKGGNLNMICTANAGDKCFFSTYRDNRYSQFHLGKRRNNTSISMLNLTRSDAGNYTCYCLVEVNGIFAFSAPSNLMELTVIENIPKPNITFEPTSGIGLQGGVILVKCEVPIAGEKLVSLLTGSKKIFDILSLAEPAVFFTLTNLSSTSARNYRCMYEMLLPKKSKSGPSDEIQLTILDVQAPLSILHPSSVKVTEGSNLHFTCIADTKHKCFFYEYSDEEYSPYQPAEERNKTTISMPNLRHCDTGHYACHCLVEVNGSFAFSALSNLMTLTVIEGDKAMSEKTETDVSHGGLLVIAMAVPVLLGLIVIFAVLAICLSKKDPDQH
ncbi:immunoglobulin superfamily member 1-like isoform X2 [Pristis pectinata]|nr:immunoglobulin superfamily member 1-like isoform X2 [Pristis pectinata]